MTLTKKITISLLALAAVGATTAYAFGPGGGHHGMRGHMGGKMIFKKLDTDKDGVITRQEAETARDKRFAKMDEDGDGVVSVAEIDATIEKRLRRMQVRMRYKMLAKMDRNGDGQIDKEEFANKAMRMFNRADANGDDQVTREEAQKLHRKSKRRGKMGFRRHGQGYGQRKGHGQGYGQRKGHGQGYGHQGKGQGYGHQGKGYGQHKGQGQGQYKRYKQQTSTN